MAEAYTAVRPSRPQPYFLPFVMSVDPKRILHKLSHTILHVGVHFLEHLNEGRTFLKNFSVRDIYLGSYKPRILKLVRATLTNWQRRNWDAERLKNWVCTVDITWWTGLESSWDDSQTRVLTSTVWLSWQLRDERQRLISRWQLSCSLERREWWEILSRWRNCPFLERCSCLCWEGAARTCIDSVAADLPTIFFSFDFEGAMLWNR